MARRRRGGRRPEAGALHPMVRDNLLTLYAAIEQGFASPLPSDGLVRIQLPASPSTEAQSSLRPSTDSSRPMRCMFGFHLRAARTV
jgi:hypothetical protein